MIRYAYNRQVNPPAPFVHVTLGAPDGTRRSGETPAQLDLGADKTVLPAHLVDDLHMETFRDVMTEGFGGQILQSPTVLIEVTIRGLTPVIVEAVSSGAEPFVLLWRDVLNHFRIILDGPQGILDLESP